MMFSEVKVGDRVRLTKKNGDESTFTVVDIGSERLFSATSLFYLGDWDDLERLTPPHPTKPGLYTPCVSTNPDHQAVWRLCADGTWLSLPNWANGVVARIAPAIVDRYHREGTLRYIDLGEPQ